MRVQNAIRNSVFSFSAQIIQIVARFVLQTIFIHQLGKTYLGVNGLFTNILMILSLADLGIGSAISVGMYEPISKSDVTKIASYMKLFKKAYMMIGVAVGVLGIALYPFLPIFMKGKKVSDVGIIFFLFLANSVVSYFFSYNRTLFSAHQKEYINVVNVTSFQLIQYALQAIVLIFWQNFLLYLLLQVLCTLWSNIVISKKARVVFPEIVAQTPNAPSLPVEEQRTLKRNVLELIGSRFGGVVLSGTDNLLISSFIGLVSTGIYSNYSLIILNLTTIINKVMNATIASVGNLAAEKNSARGEEVFLKHFFLNFTLCFFTSTMLLNLFNPFVFIWAGRTYLFPFFVVFVIVLNFLCQQIRQTALIFLMGYGTLKHQGIKSVIEAVVNLIVSLTLVTQTTLGISGVLLGTIFTNLVINSWFENRQVFHLGFHLPVKRFLVKQYALLILTIVVMLGNYWLTVQIELPNLVLNFFVRLILTFLIDLIVFLLCFRKTVEFTYYVHLAKQLFMRKK
ncbi:Membrane protein involved in the export of O-antigen and teichoic acid [Pilibacter termitis]|uniref:Membrane protein involved in the export of O-antigen and teichoic acid n=1 Tax=Pilibacter termitis TaxID=263852 RepID=A0A1T4P8N7_9ENTE|nr:oligosaccharide flippase family protein [Pilibacter termitis]SJZ87903.1 Membrane protein involved in the export of O-antigen and teichoic acid [Pilibacter termitis]